MESHTLPETFPLTDQLGRHMGIRLTGESKVDEEILAKIEGSGNLLHVSLVVASTGTGRR